VDNLAAGVIEQDEVDETLDGVDQVDFSDPLNDKPLGGVDQVDLKGEGGKGKGATRPSAWTLILFAP
jgi:hypothetical protein